MPPLIPLNLQNTLEQWGPIDACPLYPSFWNDAIVHHLPHYKVAWPHVAIFNNDRLTFYWEKNLLIRFGTYLIKKYIVNSQKRDALWKKYTNSITALRSHAHVIVHSQSAPPSASWLKTYGCLWYRAITQFWGISLIPEMANFAAPQYIMEQLDSSLSFHEKEQCADILLTPKQLSFHQNSERELLKIACLRNKTAALVAYAKKWYWLHNSYYASTKLSEQDFAKHFRYLSCAHAQKKLHAIKRYTSLTRKKKKLCASQYHVSKHVLREAKLLAYSIWWQDHRKATVLWLNSITDILNAAIAKIYAIPTDDLMYYTAKEWLVLCERREKLSHKHIAERKKLFVFCVQQNKLRSYTSKPAYDIVKKLQKNHRPLSSLSQLHGTPVSSKKAAIRGIVHIVHSPRNAKFKKGEILVAPMTSPDFIALMRKAKAIVTDIGGLMSHAAVIARELNVPCIVGTGYATKYLRDGDKVILDTSHGIIKKL